MEPSTEHAEPTESAEGPSVELRTAAEVLLPRLGPIAEAMIARCVTEIPAYRRLPSAVLTGDLVANARAVCELFLTVVAEDRLPTEDELAIPIAWGAERARDGLPLDAVLRIYPLAAREAWQHARAVDGAHAEALVSRMFDFLAEVTPRVTAAYQREREAVDWESQEHRRELARALLAGQQARRIAERAGHELAACYDVVVFALPTERDRNSTASFRAIRSTVDARPEILAVFEGPGGVLLIPADDRERTEDAVRRLDAVAGRCAAAAARADTPADIPAAHAEAADVLALAQRLGRPPGLYRLAELAVEYQLAQAGPGRTALAAQLEPLAAHPHLLDALRAFFAAGHRRDAAAAALTVHRNTLTYRLGRIHRITGLDPTQPTDGRRLSAALIAYDVTSADRTTS